MTIAQRLSGTRPGDPPGIINNPRIYEWLAHTHFLGTRGLIWARMARACGAGPGDRILDVGCGTGYFASRLAPQILPGGTVTGIDPSPPMLAYADKRSPAQCRFVFAGAEDLPFADGDFDVVVSSLAFHHIPDTLWPQAMSEIMRVLRPGGTVFIADFRPPRAPLWVRRALARTGAEHVLDDPRPRLRGLMTETGFMITGTGDYPRMHHLAGQKPRRSGRAPDLQRDHEDRHPTG